ncbi:helix-turn-helix domain-containing protein, partial [uncultured Fibrobacter sp.]|uniref:helix-turn-helix domain-containing protein n=1 Tax=uncultured Fibrobacter sp. TaxID=261512 RepID=UPI00262F3C19
MKHMGNDERNRIEFMLGCGRNTTDIAKALGRSQSTISRELLNRRIESEKHYACSNRICVHFDECSLKHFSSSSDRGLRKNIKGCFEGCPNFREAVCERLNRAPYVCNGCEKAHNCPMKKHYYVASGAQANYRGTLVNSRIGVHPDAETIEKMDKLLSPSVRNGQSVDAIIANNPELFAKYARSTIYGWIEDGLFSSKKHDLPFAGIRRKPHKRPEIKTNAKCRVGRTY